MIGVLEILYSAPADSEESASVADALAITPRLSATFMATDPSHRIRYGATLFFFVLRCFVKNYPEVIIRSGFRGLRYVDGRFTEVLEPGRYELPRRRFGRQRVPQVEIVPVDVRERELNIKGQEILTADKVAVRVNIITHFRVVDPVAAKERVADFDDRIYSDVQLAARRSLASMTLEAILTNRNQLSEDILRDVEGISVGYGVEIIRADVKDLVFPGNLQEVMNRVLTAQRMAEAQMVEARTRVDRETLEATARAEATRVGAEADAEAKRIRADAEVDALRRLAAAAEAYAQHPALLRLRELETLGALGENAAARLYIGFDKHMAE